VLQNLHKSKFQEADHLDKYFQNIFNNNTSKVTTL